MREALIILLMIFYAGCGGEAKKTMTSPQSEKKIFTGDDYILLKPSNNQEALLVLFPGFMETGDDIQREFNIAKYADDNKISILFMNFNMRLFLIKNEKDSLAALIQNAISKFDLNKDNVYFGGFSSGGNVCLLLGNYLCSQNIGFKLKGVFIVDSPIDLLQMYDRSLAYMKNPPPGKNLEEPKALLNYFETQLGKGDSIKQAVVRESPYIMSGDDSKNLSNLSEIKMRFYTEPDTIWWKENRGEKWEDLNAYAINRCYLSLIKKGWKKIEYIATANRGYRSNGLRHPHSWSIVDIEELIKWMNKG